MSYEREGGGDMVYLRPAGHTAPVHFKKENMYRRLKIPIPIWLAGCSTPTDQGPGKRFQTELEKGFEKEIENGFEIRFGKELGHGSEIEKSSVAFGFKINKCDPPQEEKTDRRVVALRKGVMP